MMNFICFVVYCYLIIKVAESAAEMIDNYDKNYKNKGNQFEEYNIGNHSAMRIDIAKGNINLKIVSSLGTVLLDKQVKDSKSSRKLIYITTKLEE